MGKNLVKGFELPERYISMVKENLSAYSMSIKGVEVVKYSFTHAENGNIFTIFTDGFYNFIHVNRVKQDEKPSMVVESRAGTFDTIGGVPLVEFSYYDFEDELSIYSSPYQDKSLSVTETIGNMKASWEIADNFVQWFYEAKELV